MYDVLVQYYDESFERFYNVSGIYINRLDLVITTTTDAKILNMNKIIDVFIELARYVE